MVLYFFLNFIILRRNRGFNSMVNLPFTTVIVIINSTIHLYFISIHCYALCVFFSSSFYFDLKQFGVCEWAHWSKKKKTLFRFITDYMPDGEICEYWILVHHHPDSQSASHPHHIWWYSTAIIYHSFKMQMPI